MEPASLPVTKGRGSIEDPEVLENVPGHVIPILEREFDDFDTESAKFLRGETAGDRVHRLPPEAGRLRPAPARRPDDPREAADGRHHARAARGLRRRASSSYAPLNKGHITTRQNIQIHHVPLRDAAKLIRELSDAGLSSREGCGNTVRNVTGDPWAGVAPDELFDLTPYAGAYVRYFVRHPTTQLMPRKVKTAFDALARGPRADRHPRHRLHRARARRRSAASRSASAAARRSCRASRRRSTTSSASTTASTSRWPRRSSASSTARTGCASTAPAPASRCSSTRSASTRCASSVDEELQGDWVDERDFDVEGLRLDVDEADRAPAVPSAYASPNGDGSEFERFRASNVTAQRQEGFSAVQVKVPRGDLTPEQLRALADHRAHVLAAARSARPCTRTSLLRWVRDETVYEVWQALRELGLGDAGRRRDQRRRLLPGHRLVQARHHLLDGPQRAPCASAWTRWRSPTRSPRKLHIKMSGCPNGCSQHHIANIGFYGASIKVGEHTIPAYVAHIGGNYEGGEIVYGQRLKVRLPAKRVPEAVERWIRFYEARPRGGRGVQRLRRPRRHQGASRTRSATWRCRSSSASSTMKHFIDWDRKVALRGRQRARASARSEPTRLRHRPPSTSSSCFLCSFQKEESVILDELLGARAAHARGDDRHRRPVPRDAADVARVRGALRRARRRRGRAARPPWTGPEHCCGDAKVAALERALAGADAWITGIRREQAATRANAQFVECDDKRAMWKYNPLADWTEQRPLAAHPRARPALPPAARPGLRLDRLRALHPARAAAARAAGRAPTRSSAGCTSA